MVMVGGDNPMAYFEAGRAGGAASSPVSAVGQSIRGTLEHAKQLGLIQGQTSGNLAAGMGTAAYKNELEKPIGFPGGVVPKVTKENGMFKYPVYDAQGRPTGAFEYRKEGADQMLNIFGNGGPGTPPETPQMSVEDEYAIYQKSLQGN